MAWVFRLFMAGENDAGDDDGFGCSRAHEWSGRHRMRIRREDLKRILIL